MPLQLHSNARAQLQQKLVAALSSIIVKNQMFIERHTAINVVAADFVLPRNGRLHESLVEYIDEFPFLDFVLQTLGQELWEFDRYESGKNPKLNEISEYADISALATRLVDDFDSLPWLYQITIPLPETLKELLRTDQTEFSLTPNIRIIRATDSFATQFSLKTSIKARNNRLSGREGLLSLLSGDDSPQWDTSAIYLQIKAEGFIDQYGNTGTAQKAERILRAIFGLGLANRLFEYEPKYAPIPLKSHAYIHKQLPDGTWDATTRYNLNDSISRGINSLKFAELPFADTDDKKAAWRFYRTKEIGTVLNLGAQAEQTVLSAQWLFDSYCGQDQLLCFIQSMVVLEILFGDKRVSDEVGIGELISNRFAYLVGTTHEERADYIDALKKIYRVRSQIVHSGKHRLTLEEQSLFSRLRWMCRRAIDKEIDLLKAGVEKQKPALENKSPP